MATSTTMDVDSDKSPTPTGRIVIQKVAGRSAVTSIYARYPLKFIRPTKAVSSDIDAVWIYTVSYGGGIVSGDSVTCTMTIGEGCTAVLTTQASTKVYKSVGSKDSGQLLEAQVGRSALLAVLPDPVTCFSSARYSQKQVFYVASDSNLVLVDWLTSGRRMRGEIWDFELYKSTNNIYLEGNQPLFLDSTLLEQGAGLSVADRMQAFHVVAMLVILGPKMAFIQNQVQAKIRERNTELFGRRSHSSNPNYKKGKLDIENKESNEVLLASCSVFGPLDTGLVVRISATSTELVYKFLREHLASIEPFIGTSPYSRG
ncbi:urease accessory protein D isoform X1 [Cryptomeria japonica]|uniref:urease accessory protein D isoform X1 n=1 Tax=Cryptomeria japonica TaxID=3369 RepID=UPI0027D9E18B|nr:urease accessory protein D isoform X1 [Cryptomeria japonica]